MTLAGSVILASIAVALLWKGKLKRFSCCLLLLAGTGLTSVVGGLVGGFAGASLFGVGIFSIIAVVGSIFFWTEVVMKNDPDGQPAFREKRTPIVSVVTGIAVMAASGSLWAALQGALQSTGSQVDQTVNSQFNR